MIEAAREAGVAAPRVRYVLKPEDDAGIGYVMDRLEGETIARKILRDAAFDGRPPAPRPSMRRNSRAHPSGGHRAVAQGVAVVDGPTQLQTLSRNLRSLTTIRIPMFELAFQWLEPR